MKVFKLLGSIFFAIGLAMLGAAFFVWQSAAGFAAHAITADGVVVDLVGRGSSRGLAPVVEFTTSDGRTQRITGSISSSPPAYSSGERVRVLYEAANPQAARIDSKLEMWFLPMLFGGLGTVFASIGGGFLGYIVRTRRLRDWLAINGMHVKAKFEGVIYDTSIRVNGRHPWRLTAQWQHPVTQKVYSFRSDMIWFDPTQFVQRDQLDVTVNADNPRQYVVDTSFLPPAG
jgi:hypothetical protein